MNLKKTIYCIEIFVVLCSFSGCEKKAEALHIYFVGDLLLDRGVREQIEKKGIACLFQNTQQLFHKADAVVANLECPVTEVSTPVNKKYIFRGNPEWLTEIKNAGITHLVMANNHSYDQGRIGMIATAKNLIENNLIPVGYGINQDDACKPILIEKGEQKVALFSSVLLSLENWSYLPDSSGMCQATIEELVANIKIFKEKHADYKIIIILHWGAEFHEMPSLEQRAQARALIDAGADAIIGHHPHVIQQYAMYKGKPIFFSIGNFIFDQKAALASKGLMVQLIFSAEKDRFEIQPIQIENCVPIPIE
jgi:poly-gamma-glutamate capsule biosynthesis protein CapA/YwtB (metallophosphatase superfamily)